MRTIRGFIRAGLLLGIAFLFLMTGCSPSDSGGSAKLSGKTLSVVTPFGEGDGYQSVYLQLVDSFKADTGCAVNDSSQHSSEQWKSDVLSAFNSGSEPDVLFFFTGPTVSELIEQGKLVDLRAIQQYDSEYAGGITTSVLNTMKAEDGLNYCVPVTGFWEGLYFNKDVFDQHQIPVPTTMDELFSVVDSFNAAGIVPISVSLKTTPHYWFEYLLYNHTGPSRHNAELDDGSLRTSMYNALHDLKRLYERGAFPDNSQVQDDPQALELFTGKKAAMLLDGSWAAGSVKDIESVRITYMPSDAGGARKHTDIIGGFSMGYYITQKGWEQNKEAAVAFVKAMTGENALTLFNANGSASPGPKLKAREVSDFVRSADDFVGSATAFAPALQDSFSKEAREYLFSCIFDIVTGNLDTDDVLNEFFRMNAVK